MRNGEARLRLKEIVTTIFGLTCPFCLGCLNKPTTTQQMPVLHDCDKGKGWVINNFMLLGIEDYYKDKFNTHRHGEIGS